MTKAQSLKDEWIKETQMFQRIARSGKPADSYEKLSEVYDQDQIKKPKVKRKS